MATIPSKHPEEDSKNLKCGACQWFAVGYNGSNCQKTRQVEVTTPACIEYTNRFRDPFAEIERDKFITGVRQEVLASRSLLINENIIIEMKGYILEMENIIQGYGSNQDMIGLNQLLTKIVMYRARVSSIYTTALEIKHSIIKLERKANMWLYSKYAIVRDLKNELARNAVMDRLIPELTGIKIDMDRVTEISQYLDAKLNDNDRTLTNILKSTEKLWYSQQQKSGNTGF